MIIVSQIIGAMIGFFAVYISLPKIEILGDEYKMQFIAELCPGANLGSKDTLCDPTGNSPFIFFVEMIATAIFVSLILTIKYHTP